MDSASPSWRRRAPMVSAAQASKDAVPIIDHMSTLWQVALCLHRIQRHTSPLEMDTLACDAASKHADFVGASLSRMRLVTLLLAPMRGQNPTCQERREPPPMRSECQRPLFLTKEPVRCGWVPTTLRSNRSGPRYRVCLSECSCFPSKF